MKCGWERGGMAGIKDVAREADVSVSTVSYVLSGKRSVSQKTSKRVMAAIDKLGYIPDASAQKLRGGINHIIAISEPMRPGMNQMEYSAYFMQTAWQAKDAGYDVLLLTSEDAAADIRRVTYSNMVDGVVLLDVEEDDARAAAAGTFGKPSVAIGYPNVHDGCACVDIDFDKLGRSTAGRLYEAGHRSVAFLRAVERDYQRGAGYLIIFRRAFLQEAQRLGLEVVESEHVDHQNFDARHFVSDVLGRPKRPTVMVSQAEAGILNMALDALIGEGVEVPDDMSVLSCGTFLRDEPMRTPVSEVALDPARLCSLAVSSLVSAIEDSRDIKGDVSLISPMFVDRGSLVQKVPGSGGEASYEKREP